MMTLAVLPLVAEVELPSFAGFPWAGLFLLVFFAGLMAAGIAAAVWMQVEDERLAMPNMDWWRLGIGVVLAALLIGTMEAGALAIPAAAICLPAFVGAFAFQHDKRVPPDERLMTSQGLSRLVRGLQAARVRRGAAAAEARKHAPAKTLASRLRGLGTSVGSVVARKPAAAAATVKLPIKLLKKDGRPAITREDGSEDNSQASDNIRNVEAVMIAAMKAGATDIHFEPHEDQYIVRMRVDGILKNFSTFPMGDGRGVISALKVISDMDISERRRPQDGTFSAMHADSKYDIRAASTPTSYGEKMVLRLLNSSGGALKSGLTKCGLRPQVLEQLREVIHKPYGMFIVAGPTGSGKTTTVYASLSEIDALQHNITTIEDPVEYRLDGITQIAVNSAAGVTFASILRSVLRQDPDVLLVGEIRDKETAEIACQAALTGHFVFSTLHANDAVATVTRLLDLGIDPTLIQTAITAVLAQRLARKLCEKCREPYPPPPELMTKLGLKPDAVPHIYREKGCDACGGSGFKGRFGLHELMVMNDEIRGQITTAPNMNALKAAVRKSGARSLQVDGFLKVLKGQTSISEIVRVTT